MDNITGQIWCAHCQEYIPDAFADHKEQHEMVSPSTDKRYAFWILCVGIGLILGLLVINLK